MCIIFTENKNLLNHIKAEQAGEDESLCQCQTLECEHFFITITREKTWNSLFKLDSVISQLTAAGKLKFLS